MSLVLNGKGRVMVGQLFRDAQVNNELPERDSVQQQSAAPTDSSVPSAVSKPELSAKPETNPLGNSKAITDGVDKTLNVNQPQNDFKDQVFKVDTSKMKSHYFEVLEQAGVKIRAIAPESRNKFFTRGGNPSDGSASGMFLIPSRMSDGNEVNDAEAQEIAKKVIEPFQGVNITNWSETKGGYQFDWHNKNEKNTGVTGTSFDEILGNEGKKKAAAVTIGEMIQLRRDELYNTMRKIAQGDK